MEKEDFTTFDAARYCEIKYQRLREWIQREHIKPSIQKADGIGTRTLFSRIDLYLIGLFKMLVNRGFSRDNAKAVVEDAATQLTIGKAWNEPSQGNHIIFIVKRNFYGDVTTWVSVLKDDWFREKSISRILTQDDYYMEGLEYEALVVVNFKKIRNQIDLAIG